MTYAKPLNWSQPFLMGLAEHGEPTEKLCPTKNHGFLLESHPQVRGLLLDHITVPFSELGIYHILTRLGRPLGTARDCENSLKACAKTRA